MDVDINLNEGSCLDQPTGASFFSSGFQYEILACKDALRLVNRAILPRGLPKNGPDKVKGHFSEKNGRNVGRVLEQLSDRMLKCRSFSINQMACLSGPPYIPSLIASLLVDLYAPNNIVDWYRKHSRIRKKKSWDVTPNLEKEVISMVSKVIGFSPNESSGNLLSGGTIANISALWVARDRFLGIKTKDIGLILPNKIKLLTSTSAHYSIDKAMWLLGLGQSSVVKIPSASQEEIQALENGEPLSMRPRLEKYKEAIDIIIDADNEVFALVSTFGTPATMSIEPISELIGLARKKGAYIHVDAAIGGLTRFIPEMQVRTRGIENADSVSVDFHKTGFLARPCSALVFGNETNHLLLRQDATYTSGVAPTLEGSRAGSLAAAAWVSILSIGKNGYSAILGSCIKKAKQFSKILDPDKFQVLHRPELFSVCFSVAKGKSRREKNAICFQVYRAMRNGKNFSLGWVDDLVGTSNHRQKRDYVKIQAIRATIMNPFIDEEVIQGLSKELELALSRACTSNQKW
ncbi:MAG: pyridoxal phosphate-dependent decarboxylase family protein [Nitrososphaerales archaeon]